MPQLRIRKTDRLVRLRAQLVNSGFTQVGKVCRVGRMKPAGFAGWLAYFGSAAAFEMKSTFALSSGVRN